MNVKSFQYEIHKSALNFTLADTQAVEVIYDQVKN